MDVPQPKLFEGGNIPHAIFGNSQWGLH